MGGGPSNQGDKVFIASGQTIRGLTKKGKEFFRFNTNLTESIKCLQVHELDIWTTGDFSFNHFHDCKETNFYMASDVINDFKIMNITAEGEHNAVLACQDHYLRVLKGSQLYYEAALEGPVSAVQPYDAGSAALPQDKNGRRDGKPVIYGTSNGIIGQVVLSPDAVKRGWTIPNPKGLGGILCISTSADFTKDGVRDLLVGREDGNIEVYGFDASGDPRLVFERNVGESISAIHGGFITTPTAEDIIVASFSGKIIALSSAPPANAFGAAESAASSAASAATEKRIKAMQVEIEKLRERLTKEKERAAKAPEESPLVGVVPEIRINDKLSLNPEDGCYSLTVETQMPIGVVALQSEVPLDLLNVESGIAILGRSKPDPESGNFTLATYRLQEPRNRMEIRFRTLEGQYGALQAFIIPRIHPKTSKVCSYRIRPLSLHQRTPIDVTEATKRPLNELRITGNFSLAEMHAWAVFCLPDIPTRPPADNVEYTFVSTMLSTVLLCQYRGGEGIFRSDNISTISILKEAISREATTRRTAINISFSLNDDSVRHFLLLLHPMLHHQLSLAKKAAVVEALREIRMQEEDVSFLDPSFLEVLSTAESVEREFREQPQRLELLHGVVKDFYLDWHRFKGRNVKHLLPDLDTLLHGACNLEALRQFMDKA